MIRSLSLPFRKTTSLLSLCPPRLPQPLPSGTLDSRQGEAWPLPKPGAAERLCHSPPNQALQPPHHFYCLFASKFPAESRWTLQVKTRREIPWPRSAVLFPRAQAPPRGPTARQTDGACPGPASRSGRRRPWARRCERGWGSALNLGALPSPARGPALPGSSAAGGQRSRTAGSYGSFLSLPEEMPGSFHSGRTI